MKLRSLRTLAVFLALFVVVGACQDDEEKLTEPTSGVESAPAGVFSIAAALTCQADVGARAVTCEQRPLSPGELGPQFLIVGGQNVFVQLLSLNVSYNSGTEIFQADVQVGNLLGDAPGVGQQLGTPDEIQTTGVRVFFHTGPTVTGGTGTATVRNADGTGMFTGPNQPFHEYNQIVAPGFGTSFKTWEWDVTNTVTTFAFEVFVEADVPHPNGFVQVSPGRLNIGIGSMSTITASVRDEVNRVVSGTISFMSTDPTVASVDPVTGVVTGVAAGIADIIASSTGPEADGVTTVMIDGPGYQIHLRYLNPPTMSQQQAFDNARTRWQSHLTSDLSRITINTQGLPSCGGGPINEVIDDLVIRVILGPIDGVGGILGSAGPCFIRVPGSLPVYGQMTFDTADLAGLEADGRLEDVILHEMGHVLGFGTLWGTLSLRIGTGTIDPRFTGAAAIAAYVGIGGTGTACPSLTDPCVPLEGTGGPGTRDAHWREDSCTSGCQTTDWFGNELMTGFISAVGTPNPLSIVSIDQFTDLGYPGVNNTGADAFTLNPTLQAPTPPGPTLELVDDVWLGPLYAVDEDGNITLVLPDRR